MSRKRKKKNWEDEDYYDSDDDTFLDRTGTVERKREERMKKAGKIEELPETYDSLVGSFATERERTSDIVPVSLPMSKLFPPVATYSPTLCIVPRPNSFIIFEASV